jgi:ABC-type iron transport system FetAB ATPase subunit
LLEDVDARLTQTLLEPAGFAHVLAYGPSGVGKTTMLRRIASQAPALFAQLAPRATSRTGGWPVEAPRCRPNRSWSWKHDHLMGERSIGPITTALP